MEGLMTSEISITISPYLILHQHMIYYSISYFVADNNADTLSVDCPLVFSQMAMSDEGVAFHDGIDTKMCD